jgi:hypothetical protein
MEGLNLVPLLIGLGALLVGWVIGFLDSNNRTAKKVRQAEVLAQIAAKESHDKIAEAEALLSAGGRAQDVAAAGALRLSYEGSRPVLEIDGMRMEPSTLAPQQRKRLIELLTVMRPWLDVPSAARGQRMPGIPPSGPSGIATAAPISVNVPVLSGQVEEQVPAGLGMVGQIDSILQLRLAGTALESRRIRLQESPEGGVLVYVGAVKHTSIDAVGDAQIIAAIRAAIAEWESKFTPGL